MGGRGIPLYNVSVSPCTSHTPTETLCASSLRRGIPLSTVSVSPCTSPFVYPLLPGVSSPGFPALAGYPFPFPAAPLSRGPWGEHATPQLQGPRLGRTIPPKIKLQQGVLNEGVDQRTFGRQSIRLTRETVGHRGNPGFCFSRSTQSSGRNQRWPPFALPRRLILAQKGRGLGSPGPLSPRSPQSPSPHAKAFFRFSAAPQSGFIPQVRKSPFFPRGEKGLQAAFEASPPPCVCIAGHCDSANHIRVSSVLLHARHRCIRCCNEREGRQNGAPGKGRRAGCDSPEVLKHTPLSLR